MEQNNTPKRVENSVAWSSYGSMLFQVNIGGLANPLPTGVYRLGYDKDRGFGLEPMFDKFTFDHKVYGIEGKFIKRVVKTFEELPGNLGVLLNGVKGTGKTVTAKNICNIVDVPVILVTTDIKGFADYLATVKQDIIVFFDEFEKIFAKSDDLEMGRAHVGQHPLLSLMDGALKNEYRRLFLLTTNKQYIEENFLSRPGRIRYVKTFADLPLEGIEQILDDMLEDKKMKKPCMAYLSKLSIVTVDIVKSLAEEVNLHQEEPSEFADIFNVTKKDDTFKVSIKLLGETDEWYTVSFRLTTERLGYFTGFNEEEYHEGDQFHVPGYSQEMRIAKIISEEEIQVEKLQFYSAYGISLKEVVGKPGIIKIERMEESHQVFRNYAF